MNKLEASLPELTNMPTNAELNIKKDKGHVLVMTSSSSKKRQSINKKVQKAKETKQRKDIKKGIAKGTSAARNDIGSTIARCISLA